MTSVFDRRFALAAAAAAYVLVPGHPDAWFRGLPLGLWPLVALVVVVSTPALFPATSVLRVARAATIALLALAALKLTVAIAAPPVGWEGRYYASWNGRLDGAPRRSTEFPRLDATRIDRAIDFHDDYLPLYFLNEADFNRGMRREVTEPVACVWSGHAVVAEATSLPLSLESRGPATLSVDGQAVLDAASGKPASAALTLAPGDHVLTLRYLKPANTDPLLRLSGVSVLVTPWNVTAWRLRAFQVAGLVARLADIGAVFTFVLGLWSVRRSARWSPALLMAAAMLALLVVQGSLAAAPLQRRALSLSGGDDWLGFEARGRAVATGDVLMLYGAPLGKADVFYYYPGYSYFLAAVHAIGGEDLSTPIFVHFLLLFGANLLVYRLVERVFDRRTAIGALVFLLAIEELAFIRHYTVTLISENVYFFTSVVTIDQLVRFAQSERRRQLVWAGVAGGVSALVRPAMMPYLGPAALIVAAVSLRMRRGFLRAATAAALLVAAWLVAVSPATTRNYVAAGALVLISSAPAVSFINYNLPPNVDGRIYRDQYLSGSASAAGVLARIVIEHPIDTIRGTGVKLGFSMGFLQLMGGHVHPELIAASVGYVLALLLCPAARAMQTWPIHAFVLAHVAGMVLTMPSNYGYRLILPMYLFFPMFAVHVALEAWRWTAALVSRRDVAASATSRSAS